MLLAYRKRYYLTHPRTLWRELTLPLISFWERGRRGWAIEDTWNADSYLARIIAEMCVHVIDHHDGVPAPFLSPAGEEAPEDDNLEEADARYTAYLRGLVCAFHDYYAYMNPDPFDDAQWEAGNEQMRYREITERMKLLFDYFYTISD
jgi:hypothetical protein